MTTTSSTTRRTTGDTSTTGRVNAPHEADAGDKQHTRPAPVFNDRFAVAESALRAAGVGFRVVLGSSIDVIEVAA